MGERIGKKNNGWAFYFFYKELPSSLQDTEAEEERGGKTNQSVHNPFNA